MQCTMNCQLINQKTKRSRQPKIQESHLRNAGKNKLVYVKKYAFPSATGVIWFCINRKQILHIVRLLFFSIGF